MNNNYLPAVTSEHQCIYYYYHIIKVTIPMRGRA